MRSIQNKEVKGGIVVPILTGVSSIEPKIGDNVSIHFNKWDGKQFTLVFDESSWLTFELTNNEKMALLKTLIKDWLQ